MKKLISLILCAIMTLSAFPVISVSADDTRTVYKSSEYFSTTSGDGTWDNGIWSANVIDTTAGTYTVMTGVGSGKWTGEKGTYVDADEIAPACGNNVVEGDLHIGATKTFTAPKDGYVKISYAESIHDAMTGGVFKYAWNQGFKYRVTQQSGTEMTTIFPKTGNYLENNVNQHPSMIEANTITNTIAVNQGDKIHFEILRNKAYESWQGVFCDPVVEYLADNTPTERMVYQSSVNFSTTSGDGTWDGGIWTAQLLNPETDEYVTLTKSDAERESIGKDMEAVEAYIHSKDAENIGNNQAVGAYRISVANNGTWSDEATRFWYATKTFTAPRDGRISISCGDNRLESNDGGKPMVRIRRKTADGRTISLMDETSLEWSGYNKAHTAKHLDIKQGETIHFEAVRTKESGKSTYSHVYWDPIVTYIKEDDTLFIPKDDGRLVYTSAENFSTSTFDGKWDNGIWSAQIVNPVTDEYINIIDTEYNRFNFPEDNADDNSAYVYLSANNMSVGAYRLTPPTNNEKWADRATMHWYTSKTFTAPRAGQVTLTCGEDKITTADGSAPKMRIRKEGRDGSFTTLLNETSISNSATNYAHDAISTSVLPGDRLHFEVVRTRETGNHHPNIYWNPVVTYADNSGAVTAVDYAQYPTPIPMYFNGVRSGLKNAPYKENGVWMVPFKECMSILGVDVAYTDGEYKGSIGGIEISVKPDSNREIFDLVDVELENMSVGIADDVMVQLDFLSKIYGAAVTADDDEIRITLEVQDAWADELTPAYVDECLAGLTGTDLLGANGIYDLYVHPPNMKKEEKTLTNDKFSRVLQIESRARTNMVWDSQSGITVNSAIANKDVLVVSFWARTISSAYYNKKGSFDVVHQRSDGISGGLCGSHIEVGNDWQRFIIVYKNMKDDIESGKSSIGFQMGYAVQTVQIADFKFLNYGKQVDETKLNCDSKRYITDNGSIYATKVTDYYGREDNALWRDEALKRIEKHRVRDINVKVVDESGNPIEGARVRADMTKSEFNWGLQTNYTEMHNDNGEWVSGFYDRIKDHFNMLSEGGFFKYGGYDRDKAATTIKYAYDNDMRSRSHCYMWDALGFLKPEARPDEWITDESTEEEMIELYTRHASRILYNFGEHIDEIDVLNEPLANHYFQTKYGREFVAEVFKRVELMSPNSIHYINEGWLDGLESEWHHVHIFKDEILKEYQELGMNIDAIGFEGHYTAPTYPQMAYDQITYVTDGIDYAGITEYDFGAGDLLKNDQVEKEKYDIEGDFLRDMIIMAYSHPKMIGFNVWTLWRWSNAVFYDIYWNEMPAVQYWRELVEDEWNTHTGGGTDAGGELKMRGHRGDYEITVDIGGLSAKTTLVVSDTGENTVTAVLKNGEIVFESSELVELREVTRSYPIRALYDDDVSAELYKSIYATPQETLIVADNAVSGKPEVKLTSLCDDDQTGTVIYAIYEDGRLIGAYSEENVTVPSNDEIYIEFDNVNISVDENSGITQRVFMVDDKLNPKLSKNYKVTLKK